MSTAWTICAYDDATAESAIKLAASIRLTNTRHNILIIATEKVKPRYENEFEKVAECCVTLPLSINEYKFHLFEWSSEQEHALCKFFSWNVYQYFSKIVLLEPDVMFLKNADELFDFPEFAAVPDPAGGFDPGVLVAIPKKEHLIDITGFLTSQRKPFDIQILNECFDEWDKLDASHRLRRIYCMPTDAKKATDKNVKIVRFVNKPWIEMERTGAEKKFWDQWNEMPMMTELIPQKFNKSEKKNVTLITSEETDQEQIDRMINILEQINPDFSNHGEVFNHVFS